MKVEVRTITSAEYIVTLTQEERNALDAALLKVGNCNNHGVALYLEEDEARALRRLYLAL